MCDDFAIANCEDRTAAVFCPLSCLREILARWSTDNGKWFQVCYLGYDALVRKVSLMYGRGKVRCVYFSRRFPVIVSTQKAKPSILETEGHPSASGEEVHGRESGVCVLPFGHDRTSTLLYPSIAMQNA